MNELKPEHSGSRGTYDFIGGSFIAPDFPYSIKDFWHRMGFLGVFADYAVSSVAGNIAEIGCGESSIYLSRVSRKYNRMIYHCDIAPDKILNPLTIPGYMLEKAIPWPPAGTKKFSSGDSVFFMGPSDEFFEQLTGSFALIFIDGDHNYTQAKKDFLNAARVVVDNGFIILHDTYPPSEEYLSPDSACGDVYLLRKEIEKDPRFDILTLTRGTAMGVGLSIIRKKPVMSAVYKDGVL